MAISFASTCLADRIVSEAESTTQKPQRLKRQLQELTHHIQEALLQPYRARLEVLQKAARPAYVPGEDIRGTDLYEFPEEPRLSAPLHCMLCGSGFLSEKRLTRHIEDSHCPDAEYRKRVLFKHEERGPRAMTPCEKRNMVQNFTHSSVRF